MVSVVCPIYNEEKYIAPFLDSVLQQDYPQEDLEVLLVDGMSTDRTRDIIRAYAGAHPQVRLVDNPHKTVPYAMNEGIRASRGSIIIRLDAHAEYPACYFSELVRQLEALEGAENVGGVCITLPCSETAKSMAIAECLSSRFGMGNSYFRVGTNRVMCVDTVPFGCFHRSLFDRIGFYDVELVRNQDDELNGRIIKHGGKIYLLPHLEIKYYARDEVGKIWNMFYQYGLYKPLVNKKLGHPATVRQFFPLCFVLGLYVGLVLSFCSRPIAWLYGGVLLLYAAIGFGIGLIRAVRWKRPGVAGWMPLVFLVIHYAYGWGYIRGLLNLVTHRSAVVSANR